MTNIAKNNINFSEQQITNFVSFGYALKKIHNRLIGEGYIIKNNKIIPPTKIDRMKKICYNKNDSST